MVCTNQSVTSHISSPTRINCLQLSCNGEQTDYYLSPLSSTELVVSFSIQFWFTFTMNESVNERMPLCVCLIYTYCQLFLCKVAILTFKVITFVLCAVFPALFSLKIWFSRFDFIFSLYMCYNPTILS